MPRLLVYALITTLLGSIALGAVGCKSLWTAPLPDGIGGASAGTQPATVGSYTDAELKRLIGAAVQSAAQQNPSPLISELIAAGGVVAAGLAAKVAHSVSKKIPTPWDGADRRNGTT